jgi:zinc transporter ZupT
MTMTSVPTRDAGSRSRDLFLWAVGLSVAGLLLAAVVRVVPSPAVHAAGLMFLPVLIPIAGVLAVLSAVFGVIALVRMRRDPDRRVMPVVVPVVGSVLLVIALPALVLVAQVIVHAVGGLVGGN